MEEIWRDIPDYEGLYQASNLGRVRSLDRVLCDGRQFPGKVLSLNKNNLGYFIVTLFKDGKRTRVGVHRLVALAFPEICGEYFDGAVVNHKDENPSNNTPENLEFCTVSYNTSYGNGIEKSYATKEERESSNRRKWVIKLSMNNEILHFYKSTAEAAQENNLSRCDIRDCCKGVRYHKSCGGFTWKYSD